MNHLVEEPITSFEEIPKGVVDELYDNYNNVRFFLTDDPKINDTTCDYYISSYQENFQTQTKEMYQPGYGTFTVDFPVHYFYMIFLKTDNARGKRAKVQKVVRCYPKE